MSGAPVIGPSGRSLGIVYAGDDRSFTYAVAAKHARRPAGVIAAIVLRAASIGDDSLHTALWRHPRLTVLTSLRHARHLNQSPPYEDVDLFGNDWPLRDAVAANGAGGEVVALAEFGISAGARPGCSRTRGFANEFTPKLKTFDAKGSRRDEVEFHPAYHAFMAESMRDGSACLDLDAGRQAAPAAPSEVARAPRVIS